MDILVEHLIVAAFPDGRVQVHAERELLAEGTDPVVLGFSRVEGALSHSTSWRFDDGAVVLTFVHVLPDGELVADAWTGTSEQLESLPVACHAIRHLHFLWHTDADVAAWSGIDDFWRVAGQVADQHYPAVAGLLARHDLEGMDFSI